MRGIDKSKPVLITGGTGYLASWIIKMLLKEGIIVNATVRDPSNIQKIEHLKAFAEASVGQLKLFKSDLLDTGSFDEPMKDCELVIHTASPFDIANILRKQFGNDYPFPLREAPKFLFWLIAPMMGYTRKYVSRNVGIQIKFDNSYSKKVLNMSYIPIEQTVKEHFQQILDDGLLEKTPI